MKICTKCNISKSAENFSKQARAKDGLYPYCKDCSKQYHSQRYRSKGSRNDYTPEQWRDYYLRRKYGLSSEGFKKMLDSQNGACVGCGLLASTTTKNFAVDHDHSCCPGEKTCGKCIRGILCTNCNTALGLIGDNMQTLKNLAGYLENFAI